MKKLFALALAVAMVLSLAAVSFATVDDVVVDDTAYVDSDGVVSAVAPSPLDYGEDVFYLLGGAYDDATDEEAAFIDDTLDVAGSGMGALTASDNVKGLKAKAKWEQNEALVETVEIVKKAYDATLFGGTDDGYAYFVRVKFANKATTASADVYGQIEVKKGSAEFTFNPFVTLREKLGSSDEVQLTDSDRMYRFDVTTTDLDAGKVEPDEEQEFLLFGDAGWFVVDTHGQGKILLSNTVEVAKRKEIEAIYPDANFYYFNGNGAQFNKTGDLKLKADEDSHLYKVGADGVSLTKVDAEYDDVDECFVIRTRTLGSYVIADVELDLGEAEEPVVVAPEVEAPVNPGTGAAA